MWRIINMNKRVTRSSLMFTTLCIYTATLCWLIILCFSRGRLPITWRLCKQNQSMCLRHSLPLLLINVVFMAIKGITSFLPAVCVCVKMELIHQTCSKSRLGWRLLHHHGEGGRGRRRLSPGQRPMPSKAARQPGCFHRRLVVPQLVYPLLL